MAKEMQVVPVSAGFTDFFRFLYSLRISVSISAGKGHVRRPEQRTFCIFSTISYTFLPSSVYLPPLPTGIVRVISDAYPPLYSHPASIRSTCGRNPVSLAPAAKSLKDSEGTVPQHPRPAEGWPSAEGVEKVDEESTGCRAVGNTRSLQT